MADAYFNWDAPIIEDDVADWLHGMSWGGLPESGGDFMAYMGWYDLSRVEQREAVEDFMEYPRAQHMPAAVKEHLIALGLVDE